MIVVVLENVEPNTVLVPLDGNSKTGINEVQLDEFCACTTMTEHGNTKKGNIFAANLREDLQMLKRKIEGCYQHRRQDLVLSASWSDSDVLQSTSIISAIYI